MDRDEMLLAKRARAREAEKERHRTRRHKDARKVPGYAPLNLNPHGMDARRVERCNRMTRVLRAWENTREYGETVEFVPTANGGHTITRTQGRPETRAKWDGTHTHIVGPVGEDSCRHERTDKVSKSDMPRAWMSYTDMVQHGIKVER